MAAEAVEPGRSDVEILLGGDSQLAATRLAALLDEVIEGGFNAPRITGSVDFPDVECWRSRGRWKAPRYALFSGEIRDSERGATLVGVVGAPPTIISTERVFTLLAAVIACVAMIRIALSGNLASALMLLGGFVLFAGSVVGLRWLGRSSTRAESELLLVELRELADRVRALNRGNQSPGST